MADYSQNLIKADIDLAAIVTQCAAFSARSVAVAMWINDFAKLQVVALPTPALLTRAHNRLVNVDYFVKLNDNGTLITCESTDAGAIAAIWHREGADFTAGKVASDEYLQAVKQALPTRERRVAANFYSKED